MSFADFVRFFNGLDVCKLQPNWHILRMPGRFCLRPSQSPDNRSLSYASASQVTVGVLFCSPFWRVRRISCCAAVLTSGAFEYVKFAAHSYYEMRIRRSTCVVVSLIQPDQRGTGVEVLYSSIHCALLSLTLVGVAFSRLVVLSLLLCSSLVLFSFFALPLLYRPPSSLISASSISCAFSSFLSHSKIWDWSFVGSRVSVVFPLQNRWSTLTSCGRCLHAKSTLKSWRAVSSRESTCRSCRFVITHAPKPIVPSPTLTNAFSLVSFSDVDYRYIVIPFSFNTRESPLSEYAASCPLCARSFLLLLVRGQNSSVCVVFLQCQSCRNRAGRWLHFFFSFSALLRVCISFFNKMNRINL